jgi:lysylphosphatidylglycerol synthetase-like protein (DUF2156 family)
MTGDGIERRKIMTYVHNLLVLRQWNFRLYFARNEQIITSFTECWRLCNKILLIVVAQLIMFSDESFFLKIDATRCKFTQQAVELSWIACFKKNCCKYELFYAILNTGR